MFWCKNRIAHIECDERGFIQPTIHWTADDGVEYHLSKAQPEAVLGVDQWIVAVGKFIPTRIAEYLSSFFGSFYLMNCRNGTDS